MSSYKNPSNISEMKIVSIADRTQMGKKQQGFSIFWAMNQIWQLFLSAAAGGNELRIWQTSDNDGNTWWHGCDRVTGRLIRAATDDEMGAWIDRHYYQ